MRSGRDLEEKVRSETVVNDHSTGIAYPINRLKETVDRVRVFRFSSETSSKTELPGTPLARVGGDFSFLNIS